MPGDCYVTSARIREEKGWPVVIGWFDADPDVDLAPMHFHCWNLMPDGRFFDATVDQFGVPAPLTVDAGCPLYEALKVEP